jgi:hypothetical protein
MNDALDFCEDLIYINRNIKSIQGWDIEFNENGRPVKIGTHNIMVDWVWKERKVINDWLSNNKFEWAQS